MAFTTDKKFTDTKQYKALKMYIDGASTAAIAEAVKMHKSSIAQWLNTFAKAIINIHTSKAVASGTNIYDRTSADLRLHNPALRSLEFQALISPPDSDTLTKAEEDFCWAYITSNDWMHAAAVSGMDIGLYTEEQVRGGKKGETVRRFSQTYHVSVKMRIAALRMKANIIRRIKDLQETEMFDTEKIGKEYLQRLIMSEVEDLKSLNGTDANKLRRDYVQMLGRTFGGFTERVEVGVVDHKKSIQTLRAASQNQKIQTLDQLREQKEREKAKEAEKQEDKANDS